MYGNEFLNLFDVTQCRLVATTQLGSYYTAW